MRVNRLFASLFVLSLTAIAGCSGSSSSNPPPAGAVRQRKFTRMVRFRLRGKSGSVNSTRRVARPSTAIKRAIGRAIWRTPTGAAEFVRLAGKAGAPLIWAGRSAATRLPRLRLRLVQRGFISR